MLSSSDAVRILRVVNFNGEHTIKMLLLARYKREVARLQARREVIAQEKLFLGAAKKECKGHCLLTSQTRSFPRWGA